MAGVEIPVEFASIRAYIRTIHGGARWLLPAELAFLDEIGAGLRNWVAARWPVDTGTSRDAWEYQVKGTRNEVSVTIYNDVDYVEWVHYKGTPENPPLWEQLQALIPSIIGPLLAQFRTVIDRTESALRAFWAGKGQAVGAPGLVRPPLPTRALQDYARATQGRAPAAA